MTRPKLERAAKQKQGSYRILRPRRSKQQLPLTESTVSNIKPTQTARNKGKAVASQSNIVSTRKIICHCSDKPSDADDNSFLCERCLNPQHSVCAMADECPDDKLRCNNCKVSELHDQFAAQKEMVDQMRVLVSRKRAEVQNFYSDILWKHYCNLPNGQASDGVIAVTQTMYDRGAMLPTFPAPEAWVNEVHSRVIKMIKDAGSEKAHEILGPSAVGSSHQHLEDLVHWRELAKWLLHRGPYRGRTSELGILAEVLGLEEKGTFWKGDWMEDFFAMT